MSEPVLETAPPGLRGDDAKRLIVEDEFGLAEVARSIAAAIRYRILANGYAIGIEGKWGSGKTTLLNFVECILSEQPSAYEKIIRFEPWLLGKKEKLLGILFQELSEKIEELRSDATVSAKIGSGKLELLQRLSAKLAQYVKYLEFAGATATGAAPFDPSGHTGIAAFIIKLLSGVYRLLQPKVPSIETLKNEIVADLNTLAKLLPETRFHVLIDDTDRLDPEEAVEILRLIKAVANFPLVTYVVCFDRTILSGQVFHVVRVGSGEDYIEKIFQQIVPVPPQEPFALRRFVRNELTRTFPEDMVPTNPGSLDFSERQDVVFDKWLGKLIDTPRDAIRLCDNVKFGWPSLRKKGDILDFIWLQLVKLKCRPLYEWIQNYVTNLGSYRDGGRPGDEEPATQAATLRAILDKMGWGPVPTRSGITSMLPGLRSLLLEGTKSAVFNFSPDNELAVYESCARLGSPSHWRFYFAFDKPSYALDDAEILRFRRLAVSDWHAAAKDLVELSSREHQRKQHYLDVLLQRLRDAREPISDIEQVGMAKAFAEVMDSIPRGDGASFGDDDSWRLASRLMGKAVAPEFSQIVAEGRSINWLAFVMRDQGSALGVTDPTRSSPERQWLTRKEFDRAVEIIVGRFKEIGIPAILDMPAPLQILFCWNQLGSADELSRLMAQNTVSDDIFLKALMAMRSSVISSDRGRYYALNPEVVALFMDLDAAKKRVDALDRPNVPPYVEQQVTDILSAWENARDN